MTDAFRSVARGLRVAHAGYLLTCWGAVSATVLTWFISNIGYSDEPIRLTVFVAFWVNILIGVSGVVTGIVGRVKCLNAPPEYPSVRGRALAAIVLEASGWLSGFVGVGISFAMGWKLLPQEFWVPAVGVMFSALLLVCGRILFLRFLRASARVVDDSTSARRAEYSLALFLADWGAGLIGWGVGFGGSALNVQELSTPLAVVIFILACMSGLAGLVLYDRVLGGLAKSVQSFADASADDEEESDAESRERVYRRRSTEGEPDDSE